MNVYMGNFKFTGVLEDYKGHSRQGELPEGENESYKSLSVRNTLGFSFPEGILQRETFSLSTGTHS